MKTTADLCLILLVALATPVRADSTIDKRAVGGLTFALPTGWTFKLDADHASVTNISGQRYCMISVYEPRAASPDLDSEFKTEWKSVSRPTTAPGARRFPRPAAARSTRVPSSRPA